MELHLLQVYIYVGLSKVKYHNRLSEFKLEILSKG